MTEFTVITLPCISPSWKRIVHDAYAFSFSTCLVMFHCFTISFTDILICKQIKRDETRMSADLIFTDDLATASTTTTTAILNINDNINSNNRAGQRINRSDYWMKWHGMEWICMMPWWTNEKSIFYSMRLGIIAEMNINGVHWLYLSIFSGAGEGKCGRYRQSQAFSKN